MHLHIRPKPKPAPKALSKEARRLKNSTPRLIELSDKDAAKYETGATNGPVGKKPVGPHPRDVKREKKKGRKGKVILF